MALINYYILTNDDPIPAPKQEWEKFNLKVKQRLVRVDRHKDFEIATYFSGISKGHYKNKLFETRIENFKDNSFKQIKHSLKWREAESVHSETYNKLTSQ